MRPFTVLLVSALLSIAGGTVPAHAEGTGGFNVTRATLANGLQVVLLRDPLAPVISTMMSYGVGADDDSIPGLAHAQEHMMFRGSRSLSASQFSEISGLTGGEFNAVTQNEVTQFFFTMPAQDLDIALHLEASRASGILDSGDAWNAERGAIAEEVARDNDAADYRLTTKMVRHLLAGTRYADDGLGTLATVASQIEAPALKRFYSQWYRPNNALLVVAGDLDPRATLAKVEALFGPIPERRLPAHAPFGRLVPLHAATFTDQSDQPYTEAMLGYRFPSYESRDYAASEVLVDVLNSQRGALAGLIAAGRAFDGSAQAQTYPHAGVLLLDLQVARGTPPAHALGTLREIVTTYREHGIPDELVVAAKARELAQGEILRASIPDLAATWSQTLAVERRTPDEDIAAIGRVTTADVNRVLRSYLDDATAVAAYAVSREGARGAGSAGKIGEDNTVVPTEHRPLPGWAAVALRDLRVPRHPQMPVVTTFPNGLRLIVVPQSASRSVVVRGEIRTAPGLEEAPNKEGVAPLTALMLSDGTTEHDRIAYQRELDAIAADVVTGTSFSLDVSTDHFERGIRLLADGELHPAFNPAAFVSMKTDELAQVTSRQHSADFLAEVSLDRALYPPGDPERRVATPQTVSALSLDDVKSWFATAYRPDLTTIAIVGDVTPERARAVVERAFGTWHATGPAPNVDASPVPDNAPANIHIPAAGRMQSSVSLVQTLGFGRSHPDYAALRVANAALSGGFSSVFFDDLRQRTGYVYSVDSSVDVSMARATFTVTYGAAPQNVSRADQLIAADLLRTQREPFGAQRLQEAKAMLVGEVTSRRRSYAGIAHVLLEAAVHGLPLDQDLIDARHALAVSPEHVRAAMAKWIRPSGFVRIVEGPAPTDDFSRLPLPPG